MLGSSHALRLSPTSPEWFLLARRWRLITTPPARGAENMALDEALMHRAAATGEWVLRVYAWNDADDLARPESDRARPIRPRSRFAPTACDVVRRPTGGRAILHDREITYSVTAPMVDAGDLRDVVRADQPAAPARPPAPRRRARSGRAGIARRVAGDRSLLRRAVRRRADGRRTQAGRKRAVACRRRPAAARIDARGRRSELASPTTRSAAPGRFPPRPRSATCWDARRRSPISPQPWRMPCASSKIRMRHRSYSTTKFVPEPRPSSSVI